MTHELGALPEWVIFLFLKFKYEKKRNDDLLIWSFLNWIFFDFTYNEWGFELDWKIQWVILEH